MLYNLTGGEVTRQKLEGDDDGAASAAFSPTGEQLAVGLADGRIQLWEAASGEYVTQFSGRIAPVHSLTFSPDGAMLASGAGQWFSEFVPRSEGVETRLWDVAT